MEIKIEYDGEYPNLCSGHLIITIDNKKWDFGRLSLCSGGTMIDYDEIAEGDWIISKFPKDFPEDLKDIVLKEINKQIPKGCCGGCS